MEEGYSLRAEGSDRADEFMERLCSYSRTTEVWFALYQGGGAYRFTEIKRFTGVSPSTLSRALLYLLADGLVRMVGRKYQAVRCSYT